ncbi:MAG: hypothetical protein ACR2QO_02465 [Acidimicrobiales bacterium]
MIGRARESIKQAKDLVDQIGAKETFEFVVARTVKRGRTRIILIALTEPVPIPRAIEASAGHDFRFADLDEIRELQKDEELQINDTNVEQVERGMTRCLLQMDGEELAGYTWVWTSKLAYITDGFYLNLPDDTVYNYKGYTPEAYRGFGFQAMRHHKVLELLAPEGVSRLFGYVDHLNYKSRRGQAKSGYVPVGDLVIDRTRGDVRMSLRVDEDLWPGVARTL